MPYGEHQKAMPEQDSIVAEFVVESREHLADVENQLLAIEAGGAEIDSDLVNTVFRAIHSIKGAAGFLGFTVLGDLALAWKMHSISFGIGSSFLTP
jgi:two-component system chemotaxis sensor kinase CheA